MNIFFMYNAVAKECFYTIILVSTFLNFTYNLCKISSSKVRVRHGYPWVPTDQAHDRT
jgi:hypothetical protein